MSKTSLAESWYVPSQGPVPRPSRHLFEAHARLNFVPRAGSGAEASTCRKLVQGFWRNVRAVGPDDRAQIRVDGN